jgi:hypothetical protein
LAVWTKTSGERKRDSFHCATFLGFLPVYLFPGISTQVLTKPTAASMEVADEKHFGDEI